MVFLDSALGEKPQTLWIDSSLNLRCPPGVLKAGMSCPFDSQARKVDTETPINLADWPMLRYITFLRNSSFRRVV